MIEYQQHLNGDFRCFEGNGNKKSCNSNGYSAKLGHRFCVRRKRYDLKSKKSVNTVFTVRILWAQILQKCFNFRFGFIWSQSTWKPRNWNWGRNWGPRGRLFQSGWVPSNNWREKWIYWLCLCCDVVAYPLGCSGHVQTIYRNHLREWFEGFVSAKPIE